MRLVSIAFLLLVLFGCLGCSLTAGAAPNFGITNGKLVDLNTGKVPLGVDRCSTEWSSTGDHLSYNDYALMANNWGAKMVRLTMNQDFWLQGAAQYDSNYQGLIQQQVSWITSLGMGVILDLHWSDCGDLGISKSCQQPLPDQNSLTFWQQVAAQYANQSSVMFELYNEPMQVPWATWLNGGDVSSSGGCCANGAQSYTAVGMQQLYDAVRATGAHNLVVIGGINWAFDLSGVSNGYAVNGFNIVYNTHPYDYGGKQPSDWDNAFGNLANTQPVMATEFGQYCNNDGYLQNFVNYAAGKNMAWTAWAWYPSGCSFPSIITDWNGTPDPTVGGFLQNALKSQ